MFWNLFNQPQGEDDRGKDALGRQLPEVHTNKANQPSGRELERLILNVAIHQQEKPETICYEVLVPLYAALTEALILAPASAPIEEAASGSSQVFRLTTLKNSQGERGIPVFTTEDTLERWVKGPTEYVGLPFRILCEKVLESGMNFMIINPAGPARAELCLYELSYLAKGMIPPRSDKPVESTGTPDGLKISVSLLPDPPSPMLLERVTGCFQQNPLVESAYVFQVSMSEGPPHLAMGVRVLEGAEQQWKADLLPNAIAILHEVLDDDEFMDFFLLNESEELENSLRKVTEPFFTNQRAC